MSRQQIICIVARQRSGTTALQAILARTGRIENFGEIFQIDRLDRPGSFFAFCRDRNVTLDAVAPSAALVQLLDSYIAHLKALAKGRHVLIDVKYNSWEVVRPAWRYPQEEPFFLSYLKKLNTLFIFIRRLDVAAQIVSTYIARANDRWQNLSADEGLQAGLKLDVKKIQREARHICMAESFLRRHLRKHRRVLNFTYESLYREENLADDAASQISAALGENLKFPSVAPIRKSEVDKSAAVKNYAEIVRAVGEITAKYQSR